jgi:hypothetical protein
MVKDQQWFEMRAIRKRRLASAVWIPLRAAITLESTGKFGFVGFEKEDFCVGSVALPRTLRKSANKLGWDDVGTSRRHKPYVNKNGYQTAELFESIDRQVRGIHLVLEQHFSSGPGRDGPFGPPPGQSPAGGFPAPGSHLRSTGQQRNVASARGGRYAAAEAGSELRSA